MKVWKSVIKNEILKKSILEKIDLINKRLEPNIEIFEDCSLINNTGGALFFNFYYSQFTSSEIANNENIFTYVDKILEKAPKIRSINLSNGIIGVFYIFNHLRKNGMIELDDDFFDIDENIFAIIREQDYIDYMHGTGGLALFLTEINLEYSKKILEDWCLKIDELAEHEENKIKLKMNVGLDDEFAYCLGLAHGLPSIILILIKIFEKTKLPLAKELLIKGTNYLVTTLNKDISEGYFPYNIYDDRIAKSTRLSWCYGDLGCAFTLYKVGAFLQNDYFSNLAHEIFHHHAINKNFALAQCIDADFCHGSVGIAHFYTRMYNYTDIQIYSETAEYWYKITIEKGNFEDGLVGFRHYNGLSKEFVTSYGLLEGISGIGLSLISSVSDIEPKWDSFFLLS